jgi:alginate O-acetyltransferase complex protein AlgI
MVIADNCAEYANHIFNNSSEHSGSTLFLAAAAFAFQIYGDFSGYSDIAIGTSRLFGFNLKKNFAFPYFSRDMAEFWRRWHISLSTWFRDYLYIPLGGSRGGTSMKIRNTFIIFLVSGFWHGANWTFIAWGALNALYFLPLFLFGKNRHHIEIVAKGKLLPSIYDFSKMLSTFILAVLAWVFFRAENINHALECFSKIFSSSLFVSPWYDGNTKSMLRLIIFFMVIEWIGREGEYAIERLFLNWKKPLRWSFYALLIFLIGIFMSTEESPFICFQF